jgi:glycosyltransferase involved in cell wall biosynthesis
LQRIARDALYFPDAQVGWYLPAVRRGRATARKSGFDVIFSSAYPVTSHLIARHLHRSLALPWVAEFRDPWVDWLPPGYLVQRRARRLELALAREASEIVMTSPSWAALHGRRWGRRVEVITNGYEPLHAIASDPPQDYTVSYLGAYYPSRQDLTAVWRAVKNQQASGHAVVDRIRFIGTLHPYLAEQLTGLGLDGLVEVTGYLPNREARSCLASSTALVVGGPSREGEDLRGHIAAKVFEYLASEVPIIYVGCTTSDTAGILRSFPGCYVHARDDVEGVMRTLEVCQNERYERDVSLFTDRALTGRLAEVLDRAQRTGHDHVTARGRRGAIRR